jgi:CheY-like chemotaxis protein
MSLPKKILVVDDEDGVRLTLSLLLKTAGYSVLAAADGKEALGLFEANAIDAVLMDYHIPGDGWDGAQVGSEMKRIKPQVPVVMFSGENLPEEFSFADVVLEKPTEPGELLKQIALLLKQ